MKLKLFFISLIFLLHTIPTKDCNVPISEGLRFETCRIEFYAEIRNKPFTEELLIECIYYERIKNSEIVLIQARLETGFFTSEIFNIGNNCFGMKHPQFRETTAICEYDGHAQYYHWTDSVKDYKLFQEWYESIGFDLGDENDEYLVFLKWIRYATDKKYIFKLINLDKIYS
jgi:hypothetical protein